MVLVIIMEKDFIITEIVRVISVGKEKHPDRVTKFRADLKSNELIFQFSGNINVKFETPYVTMEYSIKKNKILQCYGYKDSTPAQEVLDYVNIEWLPFAKKQMYLYGGRFPYLKSIDSFFAR